MPRRLAIAASLVLVAFLLSAGVTACFRQEGLERTTIPENVRTDYDLFARRCSKCHSLARPLSANITDDEQWVLYVRRMRHQPASGISVEDERGILRFLAWYAADLRRIHAEKNGGGPAAVQSVPVLTTDGGAP